MGEVSRPEAAVVRLGARIPWARWEEWLRQEFDVNANSRVLRLANDYRQHVESCSRGCDGRLHCPWGLRLWSELPRELRRLGVPG